MVNINNKNDDTDNRVVTIIPTLIYETNEIIIRKNKCNNNNNNNVTKRVNKIYFLFNISHFYFLRAFEDTVSIIKYIIFLK